MNEKNNVRIERELDSGYWDQDYTASTAGTDEDDGSWWVDEK